jgi:threonine/homoserine/homoserine lactone efflux protein
MELTVFLKGLVVGLIVCAPIGPIGLLCVKRTLTHGWVCGLVSYLGAATVDGLYCSIAGFGIAVVSNFLEDGKLWLKLFGSVIAILAGTCIFFAKPPESREANSLQGLLSAFTSTFLLMAANPFPIVMYAAMFTTLGYSGRQEEYHLTAMAIAGVFTGSVLWAPVLIGCVNLFRPTIHVSRLRLVNRVCGAAIVLAGMGLTAMAFVRG